MIIFALRRTGEWAKACSKTPVSCLKKIELLNGIGRLTAQIAESTEASRQTELKRRLQEEQVRLNIQLERNRKQQRAG